LFSCDVCSQLFGEAPVSESRNVPRAPFWKRMLIATVSSTSKPRVAFDENACTATISADDRAQVTDLVRHVEQDRAPPGCLRHSYGDRSSPVGL
jgi:hypothetical protein